MLLQLPTIMFLEWLRREHSLASMKGGMSAAALMKLALGLIFFSCEILTHWVRPRLSKPNYLFEEESP
jgi:hypothetical protein